MSRPRQVNKHLPRYVTIIHGAYWYRAPDQKPVRIGAVADGEQAVWKFMLDKTQPASSGSTMQDLFARYEREIVPTLADRTQKDYRRHLKILRTVFGHMRAEEIKPRHIGAFLERPKGKIQANRQVAVLSAVFAKAVGRWYLAENNPCAKVERNPSGHRRRYVTDIEFAAIYAVSPIRVQIAMDLALITGQRQGDLLRLKWGAVLEDGVLFMQSKTGKRLLVGLSPALEDVLLRARRLLPHLPREYVLRTRTGKPYTSEGFRAVWQRTMRKAMRLKLLTERFTVHDLRAKSVSDSESLEKAMERAGHTSMAMTRGVYDRGIRKVTPLK
jgi:integrase